MADICELDINDPRWNDIEIAKLAEIAFASVLAHHKLDTDWEIGVLACSDERIAELNDTYREKNQPTNVLSWPNFDLTPENAGAIPAPTGFDDSLGDIAVSYDTCVKEAQTGGISIQSHLTHLLIHSCLHLLGYDHETDADAQRMENLETELLAKLGIDDPYKNDANSGVHFG
ncbi:endoribonuclease YbeY [Amylibacter ulvae]|uniref:Endoribonuclease YbeY n=1 Tax=Paramylibacter ulvae TaxID=1651968 RepID=A0ABQ3CYR3_9RHOB|nr:rRNA maturation RNase YbeY [Amylibacter ulvae]GHA50399.1 endoribonuclease YbeY [Amylibacter ulvae]